MSNQAFSHQPGTAIECLSIPITLHKEENKCGFKIGGGIDQDYRKSPQGCEKTWPIQKFLSCIGTLDPFWDQGDQDNCDDQGDQDD